MRNIDISIMTISRPENYLRDTLNSLNLENSKDGFISVNLVVGSTQLEYLEEWRDKHTIVDFKEEEWDYIKEKDIRHRLSWNYQRCLSLNIKNNQGVLIFEDDVKFARGWKKRLEKTLNAIEVSHGDNYVLALYAAYSFFKYRTGGLFENYNIPGFYGLQGMYYPERHRKGWSEYLMDFGVRSYHTPADLLLKEYLSKNSVSLLATTPSLVQHMGRNTTGVGSWHQAPAFMDVLPEDNE